MIEYVAPTQADLDRLMPMRRRFDKIEAFVNVNGREVMENVIRQSYISQVIKLDDEILGLWGLQTNVFSPIGYIWLITTDAVERHRMAFLRESVRITERCQRMCAALVAHVDTRNVASIKWLEWLNFRAGAIERFADDTLFQRFERRA